ncbi:hypothetical protein JCM19231_416 [Vibrio ishigakensis]|uniref:tRNA-uridine aminocarboxypropyltransferase n=1 Tax=Vibrio ishigakensis TaxID=1481914 RepID=A0A0B8NP15_9VIBR|nr:tRNA-uridine aminocarboxypropyltransferase [Vibrio ishigakensis]GAM56335.1 hypothetical protein JCM19231_416 [Vibrio ishigakensis]
MSCERCGFIHNCVCEAKPLVESPFELVLLYHPNELRRATNTGKLLASCLTQVSQYEWSRTAPPVELLERIKQHDNARLLFPSENSAPLEGALSTNSLYIVLDATWQEAKKMLNKSPWLQELAQVHLDSASDSNYSLRRNQEAGNLCTFEVGSAILAVHEETSSADKLNRFFQHYLKVFQADRSGHTLN